MNNRENFIYNGRKKLNKSKRTRFKSSFQFKKICNFLVDELKIPHGQGKCEKVKIPDEIFRDWNLARYTIRGIMDTDGIIFVSRKKGINKYPSIEMK